jgi:hypothetical protein
VNGVGSKKILKLSFNYSRLLMPDSTTSTLQTGTPRKRLNHPAAFFEKRGGSFIKRRQSSALAGFHYPYRDSPADCQFVFLFCVL